MEDIILIKVIRGEASEEECSRVLDWMNESDDNSRYFSELKVFWTLSTMPESKEEEETFLRKTIPASKKELSGNSYFRPVALTAAAVIIVLLVVNLFVSTGFFSSRNQATDDNIQLAEGVNMRTMYVEKGVKGKVVLPDGSVVLLNSGSNIKYPDKFTGSTREVELSGEGYFDVVKDSLNPMIVNTVKGVKVKVLGTKFLLKSYDNDSETKAILYSGKINQTTEAGKNREEQSIIMNPNDCVVVPAVGELLITKTGKEGNDDAWLRGELIFANTPMPEVLKILERWYGKTFVVNNKSLYGFNLNASFKNESLIQILGIIEFCTSVKYRIDENKVIFN